MSNINKSIIVGRWTRDAELKSLPNSDQMVLTGTIAVDLKPRKNGEKPAAFIPVVIWGKQAESTASYCGAKGNQIGISGHLQSRTYKDKKDVTHYVVELVAEEVQFITFNSSNTDEPAKGAKSTMDFSGSLYNEGDMMTPVDDGEIPF